MKTSKLSNRCLLEINMFPFFFIYFLLQIDSKILAFNVDLWGCSLVVTFDIRCKYRFRYIITKQKITLFLSKNIVHVIFWDVYLKFTCLSDVERRHSMYCSITMTLASKRLCYSSYQISIVWKSKI